MLPNVGQSIHTPNVQVHAQTLHGNCYQCCHLLSDLLVRDQVCEREEKKKEDSLITAAAFWSQRGPERSIKDICVSLGRSKWNTVCRSDGMCERGIDERR